MFSWWLGSERGPGAEGMAEMREGEEAAENTHTFTIWPYHNNDYSLDVSHVSRSILPGLWVRKNICLDIRIFPFNSSLGNMESNYETLKRLWVYNDSLYDSFWCSLNCFILNTQCHVRKILTRKDPNPCWFRTARGQLTELAKVVSCVYTQTHSDPSSLITLWPMSCVLSQISGVTRKPWRNHFKKQSKLTERNKHLIIERLRGKTGVTLWEWVPMVWDQVSRSCVWFKYCRLCD